MTCERAPSAEQHPRYATRYTVSRATPGLTQRSVGEPPHEEPPSTLPSWRQSDHASDHASRLASDHASDHASEHASDHDFRAGFRPCLQGWPEG
eukprot:3680485-Prymnesium_polylepis.1